MSLAGNALYEAYEKSFHNFLAGDEQRKEGRELIERKLSVLRGIWGFHGDHEPHGDKLFQLARKVPVTTIVVDTPEAIARSFSVIDRVTARHGLVTSEMVPAARSLDGTQPTTETPLAQYDY